MKHNTLLTASIMLLAALAFSAHDVKAQNTDSSLAQQLLPFISDKPWTQDAPPEISRKDLLKSVQAARQYLLAQQKKTGNFTYAMDIATGETDDDDNQVRQAGAIWGLVRINQILPDAKSRSAILKAMEFVTKNMRQTDSGQTVFIYPGDQTVKTGTIALLTLAITDFLEDKDIQDDARQHLRRLLFSLIAYLRSMEMEDGSWARALDVSINFRDPQPSPYYDGEALLAYTRAAKALNRNDLLTRVNHALPSLLKRYTLSAWEPGGNTDDTKGFYQWGSMACQQYIEAKWEPHADLAANAAFALACWQIYANDAENRRANNAYALEGLAAALRIAQLTGNKSMEGLLAPLAKRLISRLTVLQFQGPYHHLNHHFANIKNPTQGSIGGITDALGSTIVRIDTVQHQAHAAILLLQWLYAAD